MLDAFVAAFDRFDDMALVGSVGAGESLVIDATTSLGCPQWRPRRVPTGRAALDALYLQLPRRLPALFEELLLRWRWETVDLGALQLLANPVGADLSGFAGEVLKDDGAAGALLPAGLIQFARAGGGCYDPVCFDTARRTGNDARVVVVDHEELLCHQRLRVVRELYPSFRSLVDHVVASAPGAILKRRG